MGRIMNKIYIFLLFALVVCPISLAAVFWPVEENCVYCKNHLWWGSYGFSGNHCHWDCFFENNPKPPIFEGETAKIVQDDRSYHMWPVPAEIGGPNAMHMNEIATKRIRTTLDWETR